MRRCVGAVSGWRQLPPSPPPPPPPPPSPPPLEKPESNDESKLESNEASKRVEGRVEGAVDDVILVAGTVGPSAPLSTPAFVRRRRPVASSSAMSPAGVRACTARLTSPSTLRSLVATRPADTSSLRAACTTTLRTSGWREVLSDERRRDRARYRPGHTALSLRLGRTRRRRRLRRTERGIYGST